MNIQLYARNDQLPEPVGWYYCTENETHTWIDSTTRRVLGRFENATGTAGNQYSYDSQVLISSKVLHFWPQ
jgi:hypothetical protein